jgi:hypothetical protein
MSVSEPVGALPVVRASELEEPRPERRWLIDTLWARAGVGVIGGAPKCCKSWLGLDLALSVASATSCLDAFDVHDSGPVLLYMAEDDAATLKARLNGLCRHRRLDLALLPIHVITAPTLRLDLDSDQRRLQHTVAELRPRLLLLDPFVRLHRIDENHAGEVSALLAYLRGLQRTLDLAVAVVHHARKNGRAGAAGQNLRGSGDFHAWYDSSLYLHRQRDALVITPEHRAAPHTQPMTLRLHARELADDTHLEVIDEPAVASDNRHDLEAAVLAALVQAPRTRAQLRAELRVRNERLGLALDRLAQQARIVRSDGCWTVPVPAPIEHPERNGASPGSQLPLLDQS